MSLYGLRGSIVEEKSKQDIEATAMAIAKLFKFSKRNRKKSDVGFEMLSKFSVALNVVSDEEWLFLTKGHFDPSTMIISVPETIYENACCGNREALFVMLHEMGHLFLLHRPLLHSSSKAIKMEEDSEWQADTFADAILNIMGYHTAQMSFDFLM